MLYELVAANSDVVMQRKLLGGVKQRAERLAAHHRTTGPGDGPVMNPARLLRYGAATAGAGVLGFGA